jgi:DNA polymerase-3 subunit delta'
VALLRGFDAASDGAQNALLKTLEEPAPHVVLVVTARSTAGLLPTIVSRCEVLSLRTQAAGVIERALVEAGLPVERATLLAALSGGRPGRALRLSTEEGRLAQRQRQLDDLAMILKAGRTERLRYAEATAKKQSAGEELEAVRARVAELLQVWLGLWRDALLRSSGAEARLTNPDRQADLDRMVGLLDVPRIAEGMRAIEGALEHIDRYANIQLALEVMLLDLPRLAGTPAAPSLHEAAGRV